ncbi:cobalt ECF transporter T component CbiQ [Methanofollis aquaemaris]|uniref:Cobalt ECF transporter T component CbiQ n=1 Tax=Methanofollis aquaemaris TaxID=126734 RepID=A0A8A3S4N2_9EURY|nr:cobalt ECF transporter T component CbiQ [Methanofollis aquaemaris]QSZ66829.1 cobalt ECF transporter T component CbiQ [Methanofollis aquaemaris]
MQNILDDYAHQNALRDVDTRLKLVLGGGAIVVGILSTGPVAPLFIAISMAAITLFLARIPGRFYATLLTIPLSFAVLSAGVILFLQGGGETLFALPVGGFTLTATTGSADQAALVLARTFGGMCSLFFIALTTPMVEIFAVMRALRLPAEFVDLAMLIYHFIFMLIGEAVATHNAQEIRQGYAGFRNSLRSFPMLAGALFVRAWEKGEDLILAMDARCYDGKLALEEEGDSPSPLSTAGVAVYLVTAGAIALLTGGVQLF